MTTINAMKQQIEGSTNEILKLAEAIPEEVIRWKPSAEKWSVMEVLCHVEEAMVYWLDELLAVIRQPGSSWGRGLQDEARLKAIAEADTRQVQEVLKGIQDAGRQYEQSFGKLTEEDLNIQAPHHNPKFGIKPMNFLVQHFMVEHLDTHVKQIQRVLLQYENRPS